MVKITQKGGNLIPRVGFVLITQLVKQDRLGLVSDRFILQASSSYDSSNMRDTTDLLVQQSCCEAEKPDGMFERISEAIMAVPVQELSKTPGRRQ